MEKNTNFEQWTVYTDLLKRLHETEKKLEYYKEKYFEECKWHAETMNELSDWMDMYLDLREQIENILK